MKRGFIFDLDGTIYVEDHVIEGAADAIAYLRKMGEKIVFLTNKSTATRHEYVRKLNKLGLNVSYEEVINSNYIAAKYLRYVMKKDDAVLVIGEEATFEELRIGNIPITDNPAKATYVLLGWDREFTYEKLNHAFQAWLHGATILATNPDRTCPVVGGGQIPDCGAIIGAFEGATGKPVDVIIGKPSRIAADFIVREILQLEPEQCYMVGDRLDTDIRMGNEYGMQTVLVLSGITKKHMLSDSEIKPAFVIESVKDINRIK